MPEALVLGLPQSTHGAIMATGAGTLKDLARDVDAVLIGPGMMDEGASCGLVADLVPEVTDAVVVLGALALAALEGHPDAIERFDGEAIVTPNRRELALMFGIDQAQVDADPRVAAQRAAHTFSAVVSLGGGESWVAAPDGRGWHDGAGGIGLGISGSGDFAAGVAAGLAARGASAAQAGVWAAHLHGRAGERLAARGASAAQAGVWAAHLHGRAGERLAARIDRVGYLARELAGEIPAVLGGLTP
jgi:NAD(P)H-hydrate repair Nnr-like enzyme with NAD(P)H-hydrate dehydratase domain